MKRHLLLVVFVSTILALAAGYALGQSKTEPVSVSNGKVTTNAELVVLSGQNVGIRLDGRQGARVSGTLMARVDGQWVEVQLSAQDSLLRH